MEPPISGVLSATEVAQRLDLTITAVRKLAPKLGGRKVNGRWQFPAAHIESVRKAWEPQRNVEERKRRNARMSATFWAFAGLLAIPTLIAMFSVDPTCLNNSECGFLMETFWGLFGTYLVLLTISGALIGLGIWMRVKSVEPIDGNAQHLTESRAGEHDPIEEADGGIATRTSTWLLVVGGLVSIVAIIAMVTVDPTCLNNPDCTYLEETFWSLFGVHLMLLAVSAALIGLALWIRIRPIKQAKGIPAHSTQERGAERGGDKAGGQIAPRAFLSPALHRAAWVVLSLRSQLLPLLVRCQRT